MSPRTAVSHEAATATIIDSPDRAEALADHLLNQSRSRPVVVVTTAAGQSRPYIDVDVIIDAVSGLADVPAHRRFSDSPKCGSVSIWSNSSTKAERRNSTVRPDLALYGSTEPSLKKATMAGCG